jgi:hypothetical protein
MSLSYSASLNSLNSLSVEKSIRPFCALTNTTPAPERWSLTFHWCAAKVNFPLWKSGLDRNSSSGRSVFRGLELDALPGSLQGFDRLGHIGYEIPLVRLPF